MTAEVIVDIAHSEVDKIFEYRAIDGVAAGSRVKVPFGGRVVDGFVMRLKEGSDFDAAKLKSILSAVDGIPALNGECLRLVDEIAARYHCPKALVLRLFLPGEMRKGTVRELFKNVAVFEREIEISSRAKAQAAVLAHMKEKGREDYTLLREKFGQAAAELVKKGALRVEKERVNRSPYAALAAGGAEHPLTPAQQSAVEAVKNSHKTVQLLHGVTGSGKTEIYLNVISRALERGKTAIFLVPEISLTPQMFSQLKRRFGDKAAILHSGLSAGERFDEWWRLRTGEAKIAIGARSAIFSPLENIGAIIIDEEHDGSYFSESAPRYSTVEVAEMRARNNGCKLVLGSATPSVEAYSRAVSGEYNLITLTERINGKPLPHITIADMRKEVKRGNNSAFSQALREELSDTLQSGNQAIIFLNRRGYSHTVICQDCGYALKCEHCDVSLAYHSEENCLKCHYCGAKYRMPRACPECGGLHLRYGGTGTQRVVADLKAAFPSARILRMDNDTTSGKEGHYKILKKFGDKEADILVGTQMIAKGHDFPSVTLVGILDADMSLHFSDYRAGERTFQLITQVAGRSGRAGEAGKVVLQTYSPENYILRFAVNYDYLGFFKNEVELRKATKFPPFSLICRVMVTSDRDESALEALKGVYFGAEELRQQHPREFIFLNKMHSPIKKIQGRVRYQVLMRLESASLLPRIYDLAVKYTSAEALVYVEENPVNLS